MQKWLVAVLLLGFITSISGGKATSQDNRVIYVAYPSGYSQPNLSIMHDFFEQVRKNLDKHNISLVITEWSFNAPPPTYAPITALFQFNFSTNEFYLDLNIWPIRTLSPILTESSVTFPFMPLDQSVTLTTGVLLYTQMLCDAAIPSFEQSLKVPTFSPNDQAIIQFLGNCELLKGDYKGALTYYESTEEVAHVEFCGAINAAWAYLKLGETNKAFEQMDCAVKITNQEDPFALSQRAQIYALAERYDDAINDLSAAIQLTPNNPELYTLRGQMYLYLYQWDNVLADYNKAIQLDPTYADAYFLRGVLYYSILQTGAEHYSDALSDFQRYVELAPDGDHAADAAKYAAQIQAQQNALSP
jgi:tetratricopeptide repeat protein